MRARFCPSCAAPAKSMARFCHRCGSVLPVVPPARTTEPPIVSRPVPRPTYRGSADAARAAWLRASAALLHCLAVAVGVGSFAMTWASAGQAQPRDFVPWFFGGWVLATGLFLVGQGLKDAGERGTVVRGAPVPREQPPAHGGRFDRYA